MYLRTVMGQLARQYDSFYLYDERRVQAQIWRLRLAFPEVSFLYSVKANPNREILACMAANGLGADAASLEEVRAGREAGMAPDRIYYSAPGKTEGDLFGAMNAATLIADSPNEVEAIRRLAERKGIRADIGVRINPAEDFDGGPGVPSKFGIDEDQLLALLPRWKEWKSLQITGIHIHQRSQVLSVEGLLAYYERVFDLAGRIQEALGYPLSFLNFGSGTGIPYASADTELDIASLGAGFSRLREAYRARFEGTRLLMESGRYLVGDSGVYAMKVLDKKVSGGVTFVILKNTLNGFFRPALAQVMPEGMRPAEPLFTCEDAFQCSVLPADPAREGDGREERVTLAGNLCTGADIIARDVLLPEIRVGDTVLVNHAGSYGASLTPLGFSGQERPAELFLKADGEIVAAPL